MCKSIFIVLHDIQSITMPDSFSIDEWYITTLVFSGLLSPAYISSPRILLAISYPYPSHCMGFQYIIVIGISSDPFNNFNRIGSKIYLYRVVESQPFAVALGLFTTISTILSLVGQSVIITKEDFWLFSSFLPLSQWRIELKSDSGTLTATGIVSNNLF